MYIGFYSLSSTHWGTLAADDHSQIEILSLPSAHELYSLSLILWPFFLDSSPIVSLDSIIHPDVCSYVTISEIYSYWHFCGNLSCALKDS